jgi:predicted enzyme related to lactoylglutathione lyase
VKIPAPVFVAFVLAFAGCQATGTPEKSNPEKENAMLIQYLEIVTPEVEETCAELAKLHGVTFGEPDAGLGNARTAALEGGGMIGVRAPMAEHEQPVVRPYLLVDDIAAAVKQAEASGAMIAHPPLEIPGHGTFAIYFRGGIQHGLWER